MLLHLQHIQSTGGGLPTSSSDSSGMSQYCETKSAAVDPVTLTQLVSSVQDLMPHLGDGFVSECLKWVTLI